MKESHMIEGWPCLSLLCLLTVTEAVDTAVRLCHPRLLSLHVLHAIICRDRQAAEILRHSNMTERVAAGKLNSLPQGRRIGRPQLLISEAVLVCLNDAYENRDADEAITPSMLLMSLISPWLYGDADNAIAEVFQSVGMHDPGAVALDISRGRALPRRSSHR